ncbi:MAG: hypothetical protein ACRDLB_16200 [Actinomycetota bacterium]
MPPPSSAGSPLQGWAGYLVGLGAFGLYLKKVLAAPSRRKVPTAAFHLVAAMGWALITTMALVVILTQRDWAAARDFVVVGGAGGFAVQALMGAWSFLLPSTRAPVPQRRRVELVAMEVGGRAQLIVYNTGLILVLVGLRSGSDLSLVGISLACAAAAWILTKTWTFPLLSRLPSVERRAEAWWAEPKKEAR